MVRRLIAGLLILWALGFVLFAVTLPGPSAPTHADAVIVLTGGEGRIPRAMEALHSGWAPKMLVSGVDPEVTEAQFAARYHVGAALMDCCITLGYQSVDTHTNAREAAGWVAANGAHSARLVTSDWHMRRAAFELQRALPRGFTLILDGVPTKPSFRTLFMEYNKLVARWIAALWGHWGGRR